MESSTLNGATVVFDLDGTLVDTAPDLINAVNRALDGAGYAVVPPEAVRPFIAFGGRRMLEESVRVAGLNPEADEIEILFERFMAHYEVDIAVESRPFPGLIEALDQLAARGARMGVCTNKREGLSRTLLAELDMERYFGAIVGRDTLPVCKPHPGHVTGTVARAGGELARAVMVGDSSTDIRAAQAAGVPVIAVGFGYPDRPVETLGADALIEDYGALMGELASLLGD